jgi:hypothetical protein
MKSYLSIYLLILLLVQTGCNETTETPFNDELLFSDAYTINIPSYSYTLNDTTNVIYGDSLYGLSPMLDTFHVRPLFNWDSIGIKIITAAIFDTLPVTEGNKLINSQNILWQWHSGMELGREGTVFLEEGKAVNDGTLSKTRFMKLPEGQYYWAVWGWDNSGKTITYSSRALQFYMNN